LAESTALNMSDIAEVSKRELLQLQGLRDNLQTLQIIGQESPQMLREALASSTGLTGNSGQPLTMGDQLAQIVSVINSSISGTAFNKANERYESIMATADGVIRVGNAFNEVMGSLPVVGGVYTQINQVTMGLSGANQSQGGAQINLNATGKLSKGVRDGDGQAIRDNALGALGETTMAGLQVVPATSTVGMVGSRVEIGPDGVAVNVAPGIRGEITADGKLGASLGTKDSRVGGYVSINDGKLSGTAKIGAGGVKIEGSIDEKGAKVTGGTSTMQAGLDSKGTISIEGKAAGVQVKAQNGPDGMNISGGTQTTSVEAGTDGKGGITLGGKARGLEGKLVTTEESVTLSGGTKTVQGSAGLDATKGLNGSLCGKVAGTNLKLGGNEQEGVKIDGSRKITIAGKQGELKIGAADDGVYVGGKKVDQRGGEQPAIPAVRRAYTPETAELVRPKYRTPRQMPERMRPVPMPELGRDDGMGVRPVPMPSFIGNPDPGMGVRPVPMPGFPENTDPGMRVRPMPALRRLPDYILPEIIPENRDPGMSPPRRRPGILPENPDPGMSRPFLPDAQPDASLRPTRREIMERVRENLGLEKGERLRGRISRQQLREAIREAREELIMEKQLMREVERENPRTRLEELLETPQRDPRLLVEEMVLRANSTPPVAEDMVLRTQPGTAPQTVDDLVLRTNDADPRLLVNTVMPQDRNPAVEAEAVTRNNSELARFEEALRSAGDRDRITAGLSGLAVEEAGKAGRATRATMVAATLPETDKGNGIV
ncbi:MAG: hypothetical protein K2Q01_08145, partial [Rickettsiales bacterium]|nr:hypothetical protein [Rickettsiales bacterium]